MGLSYPLQACYHGLYGVLYSHVYVLFEGVRFPSLAFLCLPQSLSINKWTETSIERPSGALLT